VLIRRAPAPDIRSSAITPEPLYFGRRGFIAAAAAAALDLAGPAALRAAPRAAPRAADDKPNSFEDITHYNNFYEFGTDKEDPAKNAGTLRTRPWKVEVSGLVEKPGHYDLDDLLHGQTIEERIYRHRCVEAWSMVIPWQGFALRDLLSWVQPTPRARFVEFTTIMAPDQMPGQREGVLPWPYVEGLRLDEAMHPLTILATGLYNRTLPNQDGAPLRLVVPWKYGFKSIKAIVRIRLVRDQPANTWQIVAPDEYGFYANVNPEVDHPRWSQAHERRIGEFFRRPTLPFNGYGEQVASLYTGMDLRRNF